MGTSRRDFKDLTADAQHVSFSFCATLVLVMGVAMIGTLLPTFGVWWVIFPHTLSFDTPPLHVACVCNWVVSFIPTSSRCACCSLYHSRLRSTLYDDGFKATASNFIDFYAKIRFNPMQKEVQQSAYFNVAVTSNFKGSKNVTKWRHWRHSLSEQKR